MSDVLSAADVEKVALLARLKLSDDERSRLRVQLADVLDYIRVLNEVDTDSVEPMAHAVDVVNVLREDEISESLPRSAALANAPETDGLCFIVPAILESS